MRVALVGSGMIEIPPPGYGAVEKHVHHLGIALRGLGHDVDVLNEVVGPRGVDEYRWALRARRRLAREGYDVAHAHTTGVAATLAALGREGRVGVTPWAYTSHSRHWMTAEGWNERAGFALERYAVARAARVVALTREVAASMPPGVDPVVIPNGVDAERYRPDRDARTGRVVLGLGVVARHKGFHLTAAAVRDLDCDFRVVGPIRDVAYAAELESLGATLVGPVDDDALARELATADVFSHLTSSEAFSLAVLEAMAAALPLVASDVCVGQVFSGENGFAIPSRGDEEARIAEARVAIDTLLRDDALRRRAGDRSRAIVLERYTWARVAERVVDVYRTMRA